MNLAQHNAIHRVARLAVRGLVSLEKAKRGIELICATGEGGEMTVMPPGFRASTPESLADFTQRAAAAFESDMAPVRGAIVAALQAGDLAALKGLRALLPHLLEQINADPALADLLAHQLGKELLTGLTEKP